MDKLYIIPINHRINDFKNHLHSHPRTLLSAKFGDGKSYFLNKFFSDNNIKSEYEFITIYPINYQVLENIDIFDILKRDILLQMASKGIIGNESIIISTEEALLFCLKNNGLSLIESIMEVGASIHGFSAIGKLGKSLTTVLKEFNKAKKEYENHRNQLDSLISKIEDLPIDEEDLYSKIIRQSIESWQKKYKKKIALVIEDLDRLDPAHIFRILNILSAQLDSCYHFEQPHVNYETNKLGFDNIILVLDYDNLKNIYIHFYGANTNFDGYISKFTINGHFEYSLKEERDRYFYKVLEDSLVLPDNIVKCIIPAQLFKDVSLREIKFALKKTDQQLKEAAKGIKIMHLFVVLLRLTKSNTDFINIVNKFLLGTDDSVFIQFVPLYKSSNLSQSNCIAIRGKNIIYKLNFTTRKCSIQYYLNDNLPGERVYNPTEITTMILKFIHQ